MFIVPNNKLSNHFRKRKVEKQVWVDDQTVSDSFYQNMKNMRDKTSIQVFYEKYLPPVFSFSHNYQPNIFYNNYPSMLFPGSGFGINPFNDADVFSFSTIFSFNPMGIIPQTLRRISGTYQQMQV